MRKLNKKNRRGEKLKHAMDLEPLEARQLYSVVTATPQNFTSVIANAQAGDTVNFQPGNYPQLNSYINLPSGVKYVGNGVTLAASSSLLASGVPAIVSEGSSAVTTFTGFTVSGGAKFENGAFNVTNDSFSNGGVTVNAVTNSHFDSNAFNGINGVGIYGYPGNNNTFNDNRFTNTSEGVHLIAPANGIDVSGNVVTGASDCGIELQDGMTNLTVENNWIGEWSVANGHMGLSIATGGGSNITISGNTVLQSAPIINQGYALEIAGTNIKVENNTIYGWGTFILNALGSPNSFGGNKIYGGAMWGEDAGGPYAVPNTSDAIQPLGNYHPGNPPAVGSAPTSTPVTTSTPTTTSTPVTTSTPRAPAQTIPAGITATANGQSGQLTVTAPTGSVLGIYASTMDPSTAVSLGKISGTSATIGGIPLDWDVTVTVTTGGTTYTLPEVQVLTSAVPSSAPNGFNPALVLKAASTTTSTSTATNTSTAGSTSTTSSAPVTQTIPAGITASVNGQSGQITVTAPAGSVLGIYASTLAPSTAVNLGTISGTSATIGGIPLNWYVTVTVTTGGTTYTLPEVQVLNSTIPSVGPFKPMLVQATAVVGTTPAPVSASGVAAPSNFAATSPNSSEVDLSWTDNTNGKAAYVLQRRATHGKTGFQTIATIASGVNSFHDVNVNSDWEYDYRLVAVLSGVASPTAAVHVQVLAASGSTAPATVTAPAAPTVLLAASPNSTEVDLSWVDNTGDTATYVLARKATYITSAFQVIAVLPAGTTSYSDKQVDANAQYDYYLVAVVPGATSTAATVHVQVQPVVTLPLALAA